MRPGRNVKALARVTGAREDVTIVTTESSTVVSEKPSHRQPSDGEQTPRSVAQPPRRTGGFFNPYKAEQGRATRTGTFIGVAVLVGWGGYFLYEQLQVFEGDELWRLMVTIGIPILVGVLVGAVAWWVSYAARKPGDFMIATEGEMKKVSWSSKREVIGSTKVVILFTLFLALVLFVVDIAFQNLFRAIGVLKV